MQAGRQQRAADWLPASSVFMPVASFLRLACQFWQSSTVTFWECAAGDLGNRQKREPVNAALTNSRRTF